MKRFVIIAAAVATAAMAAATSVTAPTDSVNVQVTTIADHINASGHARIKQPPLLNARLAAAATAASKEKEEAKAESESTAPQTTGGYRIQLFSGNNARTAKNEATKRATQVESLFPEYATYVNYDAPYWRLKVGNFRNYEEASAALSRLKAALPSYAREMRVVRDRINISE